MSSETYFSDLLALVRVPYLQLISSTEKRIYRHLG